MQNIVLLCLPPHCTHQIQPPNVSFLGPLKTYFDQEIIKYLKVVTQYQIVLLSCTHAKAATVQNTVNGFRKLGTCPIDDNIFPYYMYEASNTTDIPVDDSHQPGSSLEEDLPVARTVQFSNSGTEESEQYGKLAIPIQEHK